MMRTVLAWMGVALWAVSPAWAEETKAPLADTKSKAKAEITSPAVPEASPVVAPGPMPLSAEAPVNSAPVAGIAVNAKPVRQGYFQLADCQSSGGTAFNECQCKADIYKAEITGAAPAIMEAINKQLAMVPEQLANESCQGASIAKLPPEANINESGAGFKVTYQTPSVLTVLVTYMTYGAGSAHPLSGTEGYTFSLTDGKLIDPLAALSPPQFEKLNQFLQSELLKKFGDALFDEIKSRTDPYVSQGSCDSCTLFYTKEGWNIRFQLYSIAPYSAGEPTLTIPNDLLPAPEPATSH